MYPHNPSFESLSESRQSIGQTGVLMHVSYFDALRNGHQIRIRDDA